LRYRAAFDAAGITLTAFEVEIHSLARALSTSTDMPTLIIDCGGFATNCVIATAGKVAYAIETDFGGFSLTQSLARSLQIAPWRAEELKRRRGLIGAGSEQDLSTSLSPFLDVILRECDHARQAYEKLYGTRLTRAVIVGGGGNLPGITAYAQAALDISIEVPRPLARITYPPSMEHAVKLVNTECAAALGAALHLFT
jgi:Tfp pilus assembly PilM family ATPase